MKKELLDYIYRSGNLLLMANLLNPKAGHYAYVLDNVGNIFKFYSEDVGMEYPSAMASLLLYRCVIPHTEESGQFALIAATACETEKYTLTDQFSGDRGAFCSIQEGDCDDYLMEKLPNSILQKAAGLY